MNSGSTWGAPRGSRHVVGDESGTVPAPPRGPRRPPKAGDPAEAGSRRNHVFVSRNKNFSKVGKHTPKTRLYRRTGL